MGPRLASCMSWVLAAALGCGSSGRESGEHVHGTAQVGGDVVSTVDGHAITVGDVQALVDASGLTARDALSRLQSEALLAAEAERSGFAVIDDVVAVARKGRVQALLAQQIESIRVSDSEVAAAYTKQHARFHTPEQRASSHVLMRLREKSTPEDEQAAKSLAEGVLNELRTAADLAAGIERLRGLARANRNIKVENVPAAARDGALVKPYLDALYSLQAPGLVPEPVRTSFGWHVIVLTEIIPAKHVTLAEATPALRTELELEARKAALKNFLAELRGQYGVIEEPQAIQSLAALEP